MWNVVKAFMALQMDCMLGVDASNSNSPNGRGALGSCRCRGVSGLCSGHSVRSSKYNACESYDHSTKRLLRNCGLPHASRIRRQPVINSSNWRIRSSCRDCAARMSGIAGSKKHRDIEMAAVSCTIESGDIISG